MRSVQTVVREAGTGTDLGLSDAAVRASRERYGANGLTPLPRPPLWRKFLEKFDEPIIKILLVAALLSMVVELFQEPGGRGLTLGGLGVAGLVLAIGSAYALRAGEWLPVILFACALTLGLTGLAFTSHAPWDGLAVMVAVMLATGVAFGSEYKSDREFEVLNAGKNDVHVKVVREGAFRTVPLEEIVVGDLVTLEAGDEIPADGRVVLATALQVDQSLMTGEPDPVRKQPGSPEEESDGPEMRSCLYRGTQAVDGVGQMLVTEVGDATYLGQIARRLGDATEEESTAEEHGRVRRKLTISKQATPLQQKLAELATFISKVGYAAAAAIFLALLLRGLFVGEVGWSQPGVPSSAGNLLHYFLYMVIIVVVAVPEGLPMSVTVSLALAMRRMTRANCLVRQLIACETIGSTTVICSDKTGTLTQNRMQVARVVCAGTADLNHITSRPTESAPDWDRGRRPLDLLHLAAAVNSTANLEEKKGKLVPIGNSTEGALLLWLHDQGIEYQHLRLRHPPLYRIHFSSERKRMTTVVRAGDALLTLVKGAPEWLLEQTSHFQAADGTTHPWTPEARQAVGQQLREAAGLTMRTLAFGFSILPPVHPADEEGLHAVRHALEEGLIFAGFVAIRDPLRPDVPEAIAQCREAGLQVKMITGDNVETARAVGAEAGLLDRPDALVLTSVEFNALADEAIVERLPRLRILARARPLDKLRLVRLLQQTGEVVAVTGDGTNDAPALKRADVGLSMGLSGTEVAKEASKIILLDDSFSTIVKAVHWGRSLYENIQRFLQFQLTINVSALAIAFLGPFFGVKPPFTILQLLWVNVIMDTFAGIALCSDPPRPGLMRLPPKRRSERIVTRSMLGTIGGTAAFFIAVMMTLLVGMEYQRWFAGSGPPSMGPSELTTRQVTLFFTTFVLFQVWNEINCRSLTPEVSGLHGLLGNPVFLAIGALTLAGQVLIVTLGGAVFKVEPLAFVDWMMIACGTASVLVFAEALRPLRTRARPVA
jgi:Ca2+-transporting ATPase